MTKILVVEDDEKINEAVCRCLVDAGYGIKGCLNGENALEQMDKEKFDMVISDIMMPGMDGFTLAQEIRAVDKALPILFISARDDMPAKRKGFSIGIDD